MTNPLIFDDLQEILHRHIDKPRHNYRYTSAEIN